MKNIKCVAAAIWGIVLLAGCASVAHHAPWVSNPSAATVSNSVFSATLTPVCTGYGCSGFILSIQNKTDQNLELDWNKTLYVTSGQTSGGFMFEGVVYKDRNNPKSPDVIFANSSFLKTVYPNNLVEYSGGQYGIGWFNASMPEGENGAYLTVVVGSKEMHAKLSVNLSPNQTGQ